MINLTSIYVKARKCVHQYMHITSFLANLRLVLHMAAGGHYKTIYYINWCETRNNVKTTHKLQSDKMPLIVHVIVVYNRYQLSNRWISINLYINQSCQLVLHKSLWNVLDIMKMLLKIGKVNRTESWRTVHAYKHCVQYRTVPYSTGQYRTIPYHPYSGQNKKFHKD